MTTITPLTGDRARRITENDWCHKETTRKPDGPNVEHGWQHYLSGEAPRILGHLEDGEATSFDSGAENLSNTWIEIGYTDCGDYAGCGALGEANARALVELLKELTDDDSSEQYYCRPLGGYSYSVLMIRADIRRIDPEGTIQTVIDEMDGYPVVDEDLHSAVEQEWAVLAWECYGACDLPRELKKQFPDLSEGIDELTPGQLSDLFWGCGGWGCENMWTDENQHETVSLHLEECAKTTERANLATLIAGGEVTW